MSNKVACIQYTGDWANQTTILSLRGGRLGHGRTFAQEPLLRPYSEAERIRVVYAFMIVAAQNGYVGIWDDYDNRFIDVWED